MKFEGWFNSAAETQLLVNHKQTTLESIKTSYFVYPGEITPYIKFRYRLRKVLIGGSILPQTDHTRGLGT
jgi:hypothetical protein